MKKENAAGSEGFHVGTKYFFAGIYYISRKNTEVSGGKEPLIRCVRFFKHDLVNRLDHSQSGAVMAFRILDKMGMDPEDIADVVTAIGNHDEGTGTPVNEISAALFLADKSDVRRSRVRNIEMTKFDIHDRVNYSVFSSSLTVNKEKSEITLTLGVDTDFSSITDFFEIFLQRMILCKKAAEKLSASFHLIINNQKLM